MKMSVWSDCLKNVCLISFWWQLTLGKTWSFSTSYYLVFFGKRSTLKSEVEFRVCCSEGLTRTVDLRQSDLELTLSQFRNGHPNQPNNQDASFRQPLENCFGKLSIGRLENLSPCSLSSYHINSFPSKDFLP